MLVLWSVADRASLDACAELDRALADAEVEVVRYSVDAKVDSDLTRLRARVAASR